MMDKWQENNIKLISKDGEEFTIDRKVLMTASKYFATLFSQKFTDSNECEFIVDNSDGETVKSIIDFACTGRIQLREENIYNIVDVANYFQFDLLEEECFRFFYEKLSVNNAVDILLVADKYSKRDLRKSALDKICSSFQMVPTGDIETIDYQLMQELLRSDKIQAPEELVFERLLKWYGANESGRDRYMPEMLKLIRLEYIPSQVRDTREITYIDNDEYFSPKFPDSAHDS